MTDRRRALPAVDRLLRLAPVAGLAERHGRAPVRDAARSALAAARADATAVPAGDAAWAEAVARALEAASRPTLARCVNATGVVLHTNLGRAPLPRAALDALAAVGTGYSALEYDLAAGTRGSRHVHCAALLTSLTQAEDAMVVNNAAAALMLALAAAAGGGRAVVSRGELIEIGGGFRIPEILEASGVRLVEVGTTNRTRLDDYARALAARGAGPAAVLKVHRSNFRLEGFTAEAALADLVALGRRRKAPVLYDLGGGLMHDLADIGLEGEPTLPGAVRAGPHAVVASGDKLLGGPQAGIIVGRKAFLARCRRHPLARAMRADKLTLAALAATLDLYRDPARVRAAVPVLAMLAAPPAVLATRAAALAAALPPAAGATVVTTRAAVGGGAYPGVTLESRGVALAGAARPAAELAARLRTGAVPVVGVVQQGRVVLDVRAMLPDEDADVVRAVTEALA